MYSYIEAIGEIPPITLYCFYFTLADFRKYMVFSVFIFSI